MAISSVSSTVASATSAAAWRRVGVNPSESPSRSWILPCNLAMISKYLQFKKNRNQVNSRMNIGGERGEGNTLLLCLSIEQDCWRIRKWLRRGGRLPPGGRSGARTSSNRWGPPAASSPPACSPAPSSSAGPPLLETRPRPERPPQTPFPICLLLPRQQRSSGDRAFLPIRELLFLSSFRSTSLRFVCFSSNLF